jgi:hypothetical protein
LFFVFFNRSLRGFSSSRFFFVFPSSFLLSFPFLSCFFFPFCLFHLLLDH